MAQPCRYHLCISRKLLFKPTIDIGRHLEHDEGVNVALYVLHKTQTLYNIIPRTLVILIFYEKSSFFVRVTNYSLVKLGEILSIPLLCAICFVPNSCDSHLATHMVRYLLESLPRDSYLVHKWQHLAGGSR